MRGQMFVFSEQKAAGAFVTEDGRHFLFHISEWQDMGMTHSDKNSVSALRASAQHRTSAAQRPVR